MKRKFLSILLTLAMALTLLPTAAMAEGDEAPAGEGAGSAPVEAPAGEVGTPAAENVAQIGTQGYETLAAAVAAVKDNETITLLSDVALDNTLTLDKNLILDLNGHIISNGDKLKTNYLVKVAHGAEVSIIGNKENSSISDTRTNPTGTITAICVLGELTVDGAELTISRGNNGIAIKVDESGADKLGKLTVKNGKVSSTQAIQNWGITTIDGGTFTGDVGSHAYSNIGGDLTINDGIFNGPVYSAQLKYNASWPTAQAKTKIVNGVFNGVVAEYYDDGTNGLQPVERSDKPNGAVNCKVAISGGTFSNLSCVKYMTADAKVTVDLNGKTVSGGADFYGGDLTIQNGTVEGTVWVNASTTDAQYNHLTVAADATIGKGDYAVVLYQVAADEKNFGSTIDVYGKLNGILWVQGNIKTDLKSAANPCVINVHDGAEIEDKTNSENVGIALNGAAILNVGKATIAGSTGIEVRAGQMTLNGATVIGKATPMTVKPNGSGTTTDGAGIAVAQHTTKLPIEVTINSGAISGYTAFYESNPQNNAAEDLAKINIAVKGGEFKAINGGTNAVYSQNKTGFVTGGYFTSDPSAYLAADKGLVTSDQSAFAYKVGDKATNVKTAVTAGEAAVKIPAGVSGITEAAVKNAAKAADTTKTLTDTVAASGMTNDPAVVGTKKAAEAALTAKGIPVNSGETVTVVVQPYLEVNVKSADAGKLTLEISAKYNVVATTSNPATIDSAKTVTLKSGVPLSINKPIELTIALPTGFAEANGSIYVQHKGYEYTATVDDSGATATFINPHGFSTFTVTSTASAIAEVDGTSYTDFQKAVDAVANNGTITLLKDTSANAVVSRAVKFTLDKNSKSFTGAITAGSGYNLSVDGNVYTFTVRSSSGSSSGSSSSSRRYDVSAPSVKHGDVTVSPKSASKGDTVTITVKPDSGYELDTLTVKDASGSKIKVKDKGDGKFTFTMPASKVTVSAEFAEIKTLDFADVSTDAYYYEAVKWAAKKGITGGTGDGTFNPNGACTRAHIVTFLWRAAGSPAPKSTVSFADVPAGSYYAKAVAWAVENGITLGTGDGTFSPNATCTRAQSVTFLYRALGTAPTTVNGFTDVTADAFYADAVAWAVESGVTNGTSASTFSPNNGCTRAQIVTFLYRAYQGK